MCTIKSCTRTTLHSQCSSKKTRNDDDVMIMHKRHVNIFTCSHTSLACLITSHLRMEMMRQKCCCLWSCSGVFIIVITITTAMWWLLMIQLVLGLAGKKVPYSPTSFPLRWVLIIIYFWGILFLCAHNFLKLTSSSLGHKKKTFFIILWP